MNFQAKFSAFLLIFGVATGFELAIASADSLTISRTDGQSSEAPSAAIHQAAWTGTPADLAKTLKNGPTHIASAVREFDLSKLTMADFGDVDPAH